MAGLTYRGNLCTPAGEEYSTNDIENIFYLRPLVHSLKLKLKQTEGTLGEIKKADEKHNNDQEDYFNEQEAVRSAENVIRLNDFRDSAEDRLKAGGQLHAIGNILVGLLIHFENTNDPALNKLTVMSQNILEQLGDLRHSCEEFYL